MISVVGAGVLQMSSTFTLSGLSATSPLTTISAGSLKRLDLYDGVFANTGTFDFGSSSQAIRNTSGTGTFINTER